MKKRDISIELLKIVEKLILENKDLVGLNKNSPFVYEFYDLHPDSKFYFKIAKGELSNNTMIYTILYLPFRLIDVNGCQVKVTANQLIADFNKWINIIREYNTLKSVYDDPIIEKYQNDFYQEYRLEEEDADYAPFELKRQLMLDEYLQLILNGANEYKNDSNSNLVDEIIKESTALKNEITTLTKNQTIRKLSRIWARMQKAGIPMIKFFLNEAGKFIINKGMEIGAEHIVKLIH